MSVSCVFFDSYGSELTETQNGSQNAVCIGMHHISFGEPHQGCDLHIQGILLHLSKLMRQYRSLAVLQAFEYAPRKLALAKGD